VRAVHKRLSAKEKTYLGRARVCRVGSVDRRGVPHVAPLCHAFDLERRTAYVATGGQTAENLRARPRASIECDDYFEDWDRLRGVVARARARFVSRGPELDRARALLYKKFEQYRKFEIDSVIALRIEEVTSWGL
jgi:nitroimidazol reductase NimA-like FMN-containing flavoprotein (pyridoxamine 5'-phosphate oxidase superfamily)